ncbi:MAG: transcriptional regulator, partial [Pedobacter sp.]
GGGTHNWDIQQDRNGILYFANNEGLLSFDGTYWKIYPLPNKTIVRSLRIAGDHKIYVGGQNEFGYFSPGANGELRFFSLKSKIPLRYRSFTDIWEIVSVNHTVYFRSEESIFQYSNGSIKVFPSASSWVFMGAANNQLIVQDKENRLLGFKQGKFFPITERLPAADFLITSVAPYGKDSVLLSSWDHGLYTYQKGSLKKLEDYNASGYAKDQIKQAFRINADMMAIATNVNGCYIVSRKGSLVYNFSRKSGLQNNSVLRMLKDNNNNIWLGLTDGIGFIANSNAIKHINPEVFGNAVGHSSMVFKNKLYMGLSNAVFSIPLSENKDLTLINTNFEIVSNTSGQTWGMNIVDNHLLLGKHEGAYEIRGNAATRINSGKGYWNFLPYYPNSDTTLLTLAGNYNGIDFFKEQDGVFKLAGTIKTLRESARFVTVDKKGIIWASHPYKGVYKIDPHNRENPKVSLYTKTNGLPSTFNNHVYKVMNKIVISTEKGIYEYNEAKNRFLPSAYFKPIFGERYIRYLKEDLEGNIWFIEEKNLGVCDFSAGGQKLIYIPELNGKLVGGFEHIYPVDKNNVLIGSQKGFYHINYENYLTSISPLKTKIRMVKAIGKTDTLLFGGYFGEVDELKNQVQVPGIKYDWNSFHFEYSSTLTKSQPNIEYSYLLEGYDKKWSAYGKRTEKDYTNLPYGDYVFKVKARNNFGNESEVSSYAFAILPPWYQSTLAYLFYSMLLLSMIYYIYKKQQKKFLQQRIKFQEKQQRIKYLHQLEIDKSEKEIVKLKNEKLEAEIAARNSELASTAMHLVQKAELLTKIKDELNKLNKGIHDEEQQSDIKRIVRLLTSEEKADESWEQFAIYFDKVHTDFLMHLKSAFPGITNNDLRLSAFLKMNLSTKEIAQLMKISPRGVEISRYRLRKKIQIPGEVSLFEFLRDFQTPSSE